MATGWVPWCGYWYYFSYDGVPQTKSFSDGKCQYAFDYSGRLYCVETKVTRHQGEGDNWCWAASAQMAGEYVTGSLKSQSDIVTYIKKDAINDGAKRKDEEPLTLSYASDFKVGWHYVDYCLDFQDYQQKVNTFCEFYGIEESETFFIGGTTTNSTSIAVCFPYDGSQGAYYIAMDKFPLNPQSIDDIQNAVFTFDEMREYAVDLTPEETGGEYESETGSEYATMYDAGRGSVSATVKHTTSPWLYVVIAIVICAAAAVTGIIIRKHRSKA